MASPGTALPVREARGGRRLGSYTRHEPPDRPPPGIDVAALEADLCARVRGEVRFDGASRGAYASDLSIYRQVPIGVVIPRDKEDTIAAVAVCRAHRAPVLARGCGSSLAGQTCNVAVVLDFSKYMHEVVEIDPRRRLARVQPGCVNDHLRDRAAEHGLTFPPDPATHAWATVGGAVGNNSCGAHSLIAPPGRTSDLVCELEVLLYDGTVMTVGETSDDELERIVAGGGRRGELYGALRDLRDRCGDQVRAGFPDLERRVSGYNLDELLPEHGFHVARALVGSEGTCAILLEITLHLVDKPRARATLVCGYPDIFAAADHVSPIRRAARVTGLEAIDRTIPDNLRAKDQQREEIALLPPGGAWLLVELPGEGADEARAAAEALRGVLAGEQDPPAMAVICEPCEQAMVWSVREQAIGASRVPGEKETWAAWEDAAVHPDRLSAYLREFQDLLERYGLHTTLFGHFGQGCVHARTDNDLKTAAGVRAFRSFMEDCADLTARYGGTLSGEHGEGQLRAELLPRMFGSELCQAFEEFKDIWDPDRLLNPGKVTVSDANKLDDNLRLGPGYDPPAVKTHFAFASDHGSFAEASERCFGFGKCRRPHAEDLAETMCPSFMVTREERHSTRGRARLLFEMLQGEAVTGGWRDQGVKESLDLCLACKGCKGDCPVSVDVATYKAEFLAHHYAGRLRPREAYALGLIMFWARAASHAPRLVNALTHAPGLSAVLKRAGGVAPQREVPRFAPETFRAWFQRRGGTLNPGGRRVVLWPDTFNDHFTPEVLRAAVAELEEAGCAVELPRGALCCGRPLYDYGMLTLARAFLRRILSAMGEQIVSGVPVVGLEPSCVAVFRDELPGLLPADHNARRLAAQTFTFSEFLMGHCESFRAPRLGGRAVVHGHCHTRGVLDIGAEVALLDALGVEHSYPETSCCGMAGSFGYEAGDKHDVSMRIGERRLLPAVRAAAPETLIVADGFSCRSQIAAGSDREAAHLAQVLRLARGAATA